jgi:alpha-L-arabinofuranosidase
VWREVSQVSKKRNRRSKHGFAIEPMEARTMLSVATINVGTTVRSVPSNLLGINTAPWDGLLASGTTLSLSRNAGLNAVRIGGGSSVDTNIHFNVNNQSTTIGQQAMYAANLGANAIVDVNYGEGSPEEAIAEWAYLNGNPSDTTSIASLFGSNAGDAEQWSGSTWTQGVNWQTIGYWATLRANSGSSFLNINHAAFNFTNWEIGNEIYGSWETDEHGASGDALPMPSGGTRKAHDPTTIISFAKQVQTGINMVLNDGFESSASPVSIGYDSQSVGSGDFSNWIGKTLSQAAAQGFTIGFIADHWYTNDSSGNESDSGLLAVSNSQAGASVTGLSSYTSTSNPYNWATRAADYDALFKADAPGQNINLIADEINSIPNTPGKQMTSLVNSLFVADAFGSVLNTTGGSGLGGYNGFYLWDLHNGPVSGNSSSSLYGWRTSGDYGILGNGQGGAPTDGTNEPYPDYFAFQLASKFIINGGTVVSATEDNELNIDTYAIKEANGNLELLVINKTNPGTTPPNNGTNVPTLSEQFNISGFTASSQATLWQYGIPQDDAQDNATNDTTALVNSSVNLNISNGSFTYAVPDYSMSVFILTPGATAPSIVNAAAASPNPVTGTTTNLSALGTENGSGAGLTYTWLATGPAAVTYSANTNGTNAAQNITANFSQAGNYTFTVTISDFLNASIQSTTSTVVVQQTPTSLGVTPGSIIAATGGTAQFAATVTDQFGNAITSPAINWSVAGSGNSISSGGLVTLGSTPGNYMVSAQDGSAIGNATVTADTAPVVSSYLVNDGTIQRAMVDSLTVVFNEPVNLTAGAIVLNQRSKMGGSPTPMTFALNSPDGGTTWVLSFTDLSYIGGSLPDGTYDLTITGADVTDGLGIAMSADSTYSFYRLYGDFNGDGVVNGTDFAQFAANFGSSVSVAAGTWYFDYYGTGIENGSDFAQFAARFGQSSGFTPAILRG